jgi:hypothetical protein
VSPDGQLIYTTGPRWTADGVSDWTEYLDVSAYLGSEVRLVDSLRLAAQWPHPVLVVGPNVLVGRPAETVSGTAADAHWLENWTLSPAGRFELLQRARLNAPASALAGYGALLAVQETDNSVDLFAVGDAAGLHLLGRGQPAGCWWFDLDLGDGDVTRGLWLPLGAYGVGQVPVR